MVLGFILLAGILRVDFVVYIGYVVVGIWLVSRFLTPRSLKKLVVKREFNRNAFLGEDVPVKITIENKGRLPIAWLQLREMTPHTLRSGSEINEAIELKGGASAELHYKVRSHRRGY